MEEIEENELGIIARPAKANSRRKVILDWPRSTTCLIPLVKNPCNGEILGESLTQQNLSKTRLAYFGSQRPSGISGMQFAFHDARHIVFDDFDSRNSRRSRDDLAMFNKSNGLMWQAILAGGQKGRGGTKVDQLTAQNTSTGTCSIGASFPAFPRALRRADLL